MGREIDEQCRRLAMRSPVWHDWYTMTTKPGATVEQQLDATKALALGLQGLLYGCSEQAERYEERISDLECRLLERG